MPIVSEFPEGTPCWIELATSDREAAKDFYTTLFGWTPNEIPMQPGHPYVLLQKNGTNAAALYTRRDIHPNWATYIAVKSADASAEKVKALGGQIIDGPFDVMGMGRMAFAMDPARAMFALWQPLKPGPFIRDEANTLCWNELMTNDIEGARKFYAGLFGWEMKVSPEYTELHAGGRGIGGIIDKMPPGVRPNWVPYIQVDDADGIVEKAKSLGASVHMGPVDFPHVGRFALLADPQGASFYIIKLELREH